MNEHEFLKMFVVGWSILAFVTFFVLWFITVPYGRHARCGWGPVIKARIGWATMEIPSALIFAVCFVLGSSENDVPGLVFLCLWEAHYLYRSLIYPLTLNKKGTPIPILIVASGMIFNCINGYINGYWIFTLSGGYPHDWLWDPRFLGGLSLFSIGFGINLWADARLRDLRSSVESGYTIPHGGLYRYISCPNYLGEIIEWTGWAMAVWSYPGFAFALWTAANLVPRARSHHAWYQANFPDYPAERKALLPLLW